MKPSLSERPSAMAGRVFLVEFMIAVPFGFHLKEDRYLEKSFDLAQCTRLVRPWTTLPPGQTLITILRSKRFLRAKQ